MTQPLAILVCALGGEGGGVLAEWLYAAAVRAGFAAQATSIPGVAQRTGATTYYVEIHPLPLASLGGRRPVFSLNPVPGQIDLLVSSELLETVRQIGLGMASADRTAIVSSTARALTVAEKIPLGDGRADEARLLAALQRHGRSLDLVDVAGLARQAGTAVSAVLFGAIAGSGALPFGAATREVCEATIRASGKGVEASLRGFALGCERLAAGRAQHAAVDVALEAIVPAPMPAPTPENRFPATRSVEGEHRPDTAPTPALPAEWRQRYPPAMHAWLALGRARLVDYQDAAYAALYADRLDRVVAAERAGGGADAFAAAAETARWLALWMAFDDVVRVAHLKLATARQARVRREVGARDDEIVKVFDHFKPGVPEIAGLLPPPLARRLQAWDRRRVGRGAEPWALPLKLGSHTVLGALALRLLAAAKAWRRRASRFVAEQALIERWLDAVERGAREDAALGVELARCGRLVKGYGATNERGKANLLHVVDHLAFGDAPAPARAAAVRVAREAALADDAGRAFDEALRAHGAPAREPPERVVRFHRRPSARPAANPLS